MMTEETQQILHCVFKRSEHGIIRCVRGGCGRYVKTDKDPKEVIAKCYGDMPSQTQRAKNLAKATAEHVKGGRKKATEKETQWRNSVCSGDQEKGIPQCELYKKVDEERGYCSHEECGCNIESNLRSWLNKTHWEEQKCPHPDGDKWRMTLIQIRELYGLTG